MGGYSGGQGNSLQNSSAASAELTSESSFSTGSKVFNISNRGTGMPWPVVGAVVGVVAVLGLIAYAATRPRQ